MLDALQDFLRSLGIARPGGLGWLTVVVTFVLAVVMAWVFTPHVRVFSLRVGWADEPNSRRLNREPLANAGGLAVFASVIAALVIATLLNRIVIEAVQIQVLSILLGGSFVIIAGFIDDQYGLPPLFRLAVQTLAALLLVATGIRITAVFGGSLATAISIILTVVWVVAITNAVNLIDGIDGLAGGISFITAVTLVAVSAQFEERAAATLLLAALAGAALGFLRHNFAPSHIILGDSGAYFLGYVLAACSILGNVKITTVFSILPTALFLLLPLLDTSQVIVRRLLRRQNPLSSPGRDHLHHGMLARGFSQRSTSLLFWGITLGANIVGMAIQKMSLVVIATTVGGIVVMLGLVTWRRQAVIPTAQGKSEPKGRREVR